jgi:hypothetical protein
MADSLVENLTAASALDGTELFYGLQGTTDTKVTGAQIKTLAQNGGTYTGDITLSGKGLFTSGNISAPAWTTNGLILGTASATYTDTTSSGTVALEGTVVFGTPTLAANAATTYTNSGAVVIRGAPVSGANVTQTNAAALLVETGNVRILSGNLLLPGGSYSGGSINVGTGSVNISGNQSSGTWTTSGILFRANAVTLTDTTGTGTIATRVANSFGTPTLASTLAVTLTDAATFYIANAPTAGTNTTITNGWALYVAAGNVKINSGDLSIASGAVRLGGNVAFSSTAPTISSGFGTSPSIVAGTATAFRLNVGTGGIATTGVISLPAATNGWNLFITNITNPDVSVVEQTASTTTTASIKNYSRTTGLAAAWAASDILSVIAIAY